MISIYSQNNFQKIILSQRMIHIIIIKLFHFIKKTNYNSNEFFNTILQNVSSSPDNPIMLIFSNDIEDFVKYVQTGKDLLNKIHYTRVKRLSLYYKKNLQDKERIDEMILKLSTLLNEKKRNN